MKKTVSPFSRGRLERLMKINELFSRGMPGGMVDLHFDPEDTPDALRELHARSLTDPASLGIARRTEFLADSLSPHSQVARLGAQFITLRDQSGEACIPAVTGGAKATWGIPSEHVEGYNLPVAAPKRICGYIVGSIQLAVHGGTSGLEFIERQIFAALGRAVDHAVIDGSGVGNEPLGLLHAPGIHEVAIDPLTDGALLVRTMEETVSTAHGEGDPSDMGFMTSPLVRKAWRDLPRADGSGTLWPDGPGRGPLGCGGAASPFAPEAGGETPATVIYGDWSKVAVSMWGGLRLLANPYSMDKEGMMRVTVTGFADISILDPKAFARSVAPED